jgi:formiminotetrahydrofolate cyclodeaminase
MAELAGNRGDRIVTADETIASWLESLAQRGANPGGGAAAALMAGMAAALAEMVAAYRSAASENAAENDAESDAERDAERGARAQGAFAAAIREAAPSMADRDTEASAGFAAASRTEGSEAEQRAAKQAASMSAAESSAALGRFAASLVPVLHELASDAGTLLLADVGVAAATLAASARAAALNISADLRLAKDSGEGREDLLGALDRLDSTVRELDGIAEAVRVRLDPRSH